MNAILIGSRALGEYGFDQYDNVKSDFDLILSDTLAGRLALKCEKKEKSMYWYGNNKFDFCIVNDDDCDAMDSFILDWCNKNPDECKHLTIESVDITVFIPPLEILYAVYKSHIHRILPVTKSQSQNIEIWKKHVHKYLWCRNKLGYTKMDKIIYGESTPANEFENIVKKIYNLGFNQVSLRVGDTHVTLEKEQTSNEFFNDNVKRYIDHDQLHLKVAQMCRGKDAQPLFTNFQNNENTVEMDKQLFVVADRSEQLATISEEIMVLSLERKWIPEVMELYKQKNEPYPAYNAERKWQEIKETIAHFVTNLCGSGQHWLRRWCLDHYHLISSKHLYSLDNMCQLVLEICNIKTIKEYNKGTWSNFIDKFKNHYTQWDKYVYNSFDKYQTYALIDDVYIDHPDIHEICKCFDDDYLITFNNSNTHCRIIFDKSKGIGLCETCEYIFFCHYDDRHSRNNDNDEQFNIYGKMFCLQNNDNKKTNSLQLNCEYEKRIETIYYYSRDNSCGWKNPRGQGTRKYISSYGTIYDSKCLANFFEQLARNALSLKHDEQPTSDDDVEWSYCDTYY